jgi:ATP-dependent DNA ligase
MSRRQGVMLCYPWEEKRLAKWLRPWIVQPKYKGIRCKTYILEKGSVAMVSSEANVIETVPDIKRAITNAGLRPGTILDGELYIHNVHQGTINSILLRSKALHPEHISVNYEVFDCPNIQMKLQDRLAILEGLIGGINHEKIIPVPTYYAESVEHIKDLLLEFKANNYEGIVAKNSQSLYEEKRSTNWMKWKPGEMDTYIIVGFKEEISIHGEPKNALGALICRSGDEETFAVGTGPTREQRIKYWAYRERLIGKVALVGYQAITARGVPEHPVLIDVS